MALVGKGLTFDSGGYNLKVGAGSMIELMKFDMGGCAAVLGCAKAIAQLRPKVKKYERQKVACCYVDVDKIMRTCSSFVLSELDTIHYSDEKKHILCTS